MLEFFYFMFSSHVDEFDDFHEIRQKNQNMEQLRAHTWCTQIAFSNLKIQRHQHVTNCDMQRENLSFEAYNSSR